jgi:plasmid stabilization system protein ParE
MLDFHPDAMDEFKSSVAWYRERSSQAAVGFLEAVDDVLAIIEDDPDRSAPDKYGYRRRRLQKYPYEIVYTQTVRGFRIIAVAHTSRRPGYWRSRR